MADLSRIEKWTCTAVSILILTCISLTVAVVISVEPNESDPIQTLFSEPVWGYICTNNRCLKTRLDENTRNEAIGLSRCRQTCGLPQPMDFWPKPWKGKISADNEGWTELHGDSIEFYDSNQNDNLKRFWLEMENRFRRQLKNKLPKYQIQNATEKMPCDIHLWTDSIDQRLTMEVDETYTISGKRSIVRRENRFQIDVKAKSIFGVRHALETIIQIIVFDDVTNQLMVRNSFEIEDGPAYPHRGMHLDTARNYYSVESIKRTIDAMAMVKLNVFHWHITDTQSFPLVLKSQPNLAKYGAYSSEQIYTAKDVTEIVEYGYYRGVRVIPELDAPAHLGEGWQFTNLLTCFEELWTEYCQEPPCGQVDPTQDELYDILEDIYREMYEMFKQPDVFHMGGDEVSISCWNNTKTITKWMTDRGWGLEKDDFMKLWNYFQTEALKRMDKVTGEKKIFMWTSALTDLPYLTQYLDKDRYIIQVWTTGYDPQVVNILKSGYKVIISNYDSLYLDCGFESWVALGNNWCSPYSGWHKIYTNYMYWGPEYTNQILGGESALWSEQAGEQSLDTRMWPRGIALAEWLWSAPETSYRLAEPRILMQRERFIQNGIQADAMQPQWCVQNHGKCPSHQ